MSLALLLGAGVASAQSNPENPHDTKNKDRSAPAASPTTDQSANPHATENKDRQAVGSASKTSIDAAEKDNPHAIENKDRDKAGAMGMNHEGMNEKPTASAVLERMHVANLGEVQMGELALKNGSPRLADYGRMLQDDHSAADRKVMDLAKTKGLSLGDTPKDGMARKEMEKAHDMHGKLMSMKGVEFDKAFAKAMVEDHQKDIAHLRMWRTAANDKDLSALIDETLPKLEQHLKTAQSLQRPMAQGRTP